MLKIEKIDKNRPKSLRIISKYTQVKLRQYFYSFSHSSKYLTTQRMHLRCFAKAIIGFDCELENVVL